jgi:cbb3-type cytochrome oxidase cytochrome c subunit
MNRIIGVVTAFIFIVLVSITWGQNTQSQTTKRAADQVFLDSKCNSCHSIETKHIEKQSGGYTKEIEKNVPPDLSKVGSRHNAEWIKNYLTRKETKEGLPHAKLFRGSEENLKTLVDWLAGLK